MRKQLIVFGLLLASLSVGLAQQQYDPISSTRKSLFSTTKRKTPIHKALLTQRGYIQFLRWELPVPEIEEFTFCLWVKSTNLTYAHSIFSYSKDERERLVRSWISPYGESVHLEIGNVEILAHPTLIKEHRWYHICQSWENSQGHYALWIDGRIEAEGFSKQLSGHVIPSNGDIVLGQEYTDFDKGLEEGIEGAVLGFNLVLSSAFLPGVRKIRPVSRFSNQIIDDPNPTTGRLVQIGPEFDLSPEIQIRRSLDVDSTNTASPSPVASTTQLLRGRILNLKKNEPTEQSHRVRFDDPTPVIQKIREDYANFQNNFNSPRPDREEEEVVFNQDYAPVKGVPSPVLSRTTLLESTPEDASYGIRNTKGNVLMNYPAKIVNDRRESLFERTLEEYLGDQADIGSNLQKRESSEGSNGKQVISVRITHKSKRDLTEESRKRDNEWVERVKRGEKPLGLQLVDLSYSRCELGRGSPFIGGSRMLISWTRTPVRVFGGAILKNAASDCGNF